MTDPLEQALRELHVEWPATPDLAAAVRARLEAEPAAAGVAGSAGGVPAPRRRRAGSLAGVPSSRRWRIGAGAPLAARLRPLLPRLALAAAAVIALAAGVLAVSPDARSAVERWLGLRSVEVRRVPPPAKPTATATPEPPGASLGLGDPVTLAQARRAVDFPVPTAPILGTPDAIYLGQVPTGGPRISLLYGRILITAFRATATPVIQKTVYAATRFERLNVDGARAYWIAGAHGFAYAVPRGNAVYEPQRVADRTLLVERNGVLLRIEGHISRDRAIAIARSASVQ